jgi:hypothetical protein
MILNKRILSYEFWPFWVLYIPAYFYWMYLAIRAKNFTYFTTLNPLMNNSGAFEVSKWSYLSKFPENWIPKTFKANKETSKRELDQLIQSHQISFPIVAKPDDSERGKEVRILNSIDELDAYFRNSHFEELLIQEFCAYENEAGILFYKLPDESRFEITSITEKVFCSIQGDGQKTLGYLIRSNIRLKHRIVFLEKKFKNEWNHILPSGKNLLIEPVGSHNLGTEFRDARSKITPQLTKTLKEWSDQLPGFYYGRFDIKFNSWDALEKGEEFKILEVNGVNSEPTHIYQSSYGLWKAYRDIFYHMDLIYEISKINKSLGYQTVPVKKFVNGIIRIVTL